MHGTQFQTPPYNKASEIGQICAACKLAMPIFKM